MARNTVMLVLLAQLILGNGQFYDMSDGNNEELICPCVGGGATGQCKSEYAIKYLGGPIHGFVYSTDTSVSCIDVPDPITLTENSNFYMQVHVPYTRSLELMQVAVMNERGQWMEWFQISGPIPENERWMEISVPRPPTINPGTYKIAIWDHSIWNKISIRSFAITEEGDCAADNF